MFNPLRQHHRLCAISVTPLQGCVPSRPTLHRRAANHLCVVFDRLRPANETVLNFVAASLARYLSCSSVSMPSATTAADGDQRADDRCRLPGVAQIGDHAIAGFRNGFEAEMFSVASKMQNRSLGRLREFPGHKGERNRVWAGAPTVLTSPRAA